MAKFTDARVVTLKSYFNAGDQPTEAQFASLIDAIQEGIEEHDHAGTGDGDGVNNLVGPVGIGCVPSEALVIGDDFGNILTGECIVIGNSASDGSLLVGQDATHNLVMMWDYNVVPGSAVGILAAWGGSNHLALQAWGGNVGLGTLTPFTPTGWTGPGLTIKAPTPVITLVDSGSADKTRYIGNEVGMLYIGLCDDDGANPANQITVSDAGVVKIIDLAGVGQRDVRVNADGTLVAV